MDNEAEQLSNELLQTAGIRINGSQPWDMQIRDQRVFNHALTQGSLGLGESYINGWWDCAALDQFFTRILQADIDQKVTIKNKLFLKVLLSRLFNRQSRKRSLEVGKKHYDLGNILFENMLDSRMNYTCGYWQNASNLDEAQLHKLELTCKKLRLEPGMRLLDVGCGFGALLKYAAERYGIEGVGVSISEEQCRYARKNCAGLPVEIRFQDYRDLTESFDRIVSLGMFEHVGYLNYKKYMQIMHANLHDDGLFLLHTIGNNVSTVRIDEWIDNYIFPNGTLPSIAQIGEASEGLFVMEDWHNFGADYDKTLMAWHANFNQNWPLLKQEFDERFHRIWNYYLLSCAGNFRARKIQLWQIVYSKNGVEGGYTRPSI